MPDARLVKLWSNIKKQVNKAHGDIIAGNLLFSSIVDFLSRFVAIYTDDASKLLIPYISLGEMLLCGNGFTTAFTNNSLKDSAILDGIVNEKISLTHQDFIDVEVEDKYDCILLLPVSENGMSYRDKVYRYFDKCFSLLAEGGHLIAIVPQRWLCDSIHMRFFDEICSNYSVDGVINIGRINSQIEYDCALLDISNREQIPSIQMSVTFTDAHKFIDSYKLKKAGFAVSATELQGRLDPEFYDPNNVKIRKEIMNKNTTELASLATVIRGMHATTKPVEEGYIVITSECIYDKQIHIDKAPAGYYSKDEIQKRNKSQCILKHGDFVVNLIGKKFDWAYYSGLDNIAVADFDVAIIRCHEETAVWLKLFFNTQSGNEYLDHMLNCVSPGHGFHRLSLSFLTRLPIPDSLSLSHIIDQVNSVAELEDRVAILFDNLGWEVRRRYMPDASKGYAYDMALYYEGELRGIVETKTYAITQETHKRLIRELSALTFDNPAIRTFIYSKDKLFQCINGTIVPVPVLPRPDDPALDTSITSINEKDSTVGHLPPNERSTADSLLWEVTTKLDKVLESQNRMEHKIDLITDMLKQLTDQITSYQSLVDRQLNIAVSQDESERILHAFADECTERIERQISQNASENEFTIEKQKLVFTFSQETWERLDDFSQRFLISSKLMFNHLLTMDDIVDYSGVCLLVTKALEVELSKRFGTNYITFLKEKYPGKAGYAQFPTPLLTQYKKPISPKNFTLGSVAYVLCHSFSNGLTDEQKQLNRDRLIEYAKAKLFKDKSDDDILDILDEYACFIEEVREDYRNPSAHTNRLRRVDAEQCFNLVVDVEKLLKKMLESFTGETENI